MLQPSSWSITVREDGPFSAIRLNSSERGWGVVNAKGALYQDGRLAMKLTESEARALAIKLNADPDDRPPSAAALRS